MDFSFVIKLLKMLIKVQNFSRNSTLKQKTKKTDSLTNLIGRTFSSKHYNQRLNQKLRSKTNENLPGQKFDFIVNENMLQTYMDTFVEDYPYAVDFGNSVTSSISSYDGRKLRRKIRLIKKRQLSKPSKMEKEYEWLINLIFDFYSSN